MDFGQTLDMLMRAIPASVSGIKVVMRQELLALGLPTELLQIVYINGEWLYRFEKVLSLEGLIVLAVLFYVQALGRLRPRPLLGLGTMVLALAFSGLLGWGSRFGLALALRDSYRNDVRLMALTSSVKSAEPSEVKGPQAVDSSSLAAIRERGVLRVGFRSDGLPWAYRNRSGRLVGLDVDLLTLLATSLGVRLRIQEAPLGSLEQWLRQGRLDLVAGGIQSSPSRAIKFELSRGYLTVHLALVVPDAKVKLLQGGKAVGLGRPVELAVRDEAILSPGLEEQLGAYLGSRANPVAVHIQYLNQKGDFFHAAAQRHFDGLLTTAESGAAWAVIHPNNSLITPFSDELSSELVLMMGTDDTSLRRYVNGWLSREIARGGIQRLFNHWILLQS
jgi:ABC-type amino acid transport substrate-binding protein